MDFFSPFETEKRDSRRRFTKTQQDAIWVRQNGKCVKCPNTLDPRTVRYHHITAHSEGGITAVENGQALCANCHSKEHHKTRLKKLESKKQKSPFELDLGF